MPVTIEDVPEDGWAFFDHDMQDIPVGLASDEEDSDSDDEMEGVDDEVEGSDDELDGFDNEMEGNDDEMEGIEWANAAHIEQAAPILADLNAEDANAEDIEPQILFAPDGETGGYVGRTERCLRKLNALSPTEIQRRIVKIIKYMNTLDFDLTTLLIFMSWRLDGITKLDGTIKYARGALMQPKYLLPLLKIWLRPPRTHAGGRRTRAGRIAIDELVLERVNEKIAKEMRALGPKLKTPQKEFPRASMLELTLPRLIHACQTATPTLWAIMRNAAQSPTQAKRNTYKDPDPTVMMAIASLAYQRSHHHNLVQKFNCVYFKASGISAKALDTLNAYSITMSQKSAYRLIEAISQAEIEERNALVQKYRWNAGHDNLNLGFHVYQPRLDKNSHFDSGTAGTVYIVDDLSAEAPDPWAYREKWREGVKDPITSEVLYDLEIDAAPRIRSWALYFIIRVLADCPAFALSSYRHKDSQLFGRPPAVKPLPSGPEHITRQYMLSTVHINEATLEGNEAVEDEFLGQLGYRTDKAKRELALNQLIVWMGDQLTVERMRGVARDHAHDLNAAERREHILPQFGWFHAQMAQEHSIHTQHFLTSAAMGLQHDFSLLGGVDDIAQLRDKDPEDLLATANEIIDDFASSGAIHRHKALPTEEQDHTMLNSMVFCRDILDYVNLDDALRTGDVGRVRDHLPRLFFRYHGGKNYKYAIEILELVQGLEREWPDGLREYIMTWCWLANTTGNPGAFLPFDMLQEHNIRDIKVIFAVHGPFATWEYISKISSSIPYQRKLKDHVEAQFNHYRRGKTHTDPAKEVDVERLREAYKAGNAHRYKPGRKLPEKARVKDVCAIGCAQDKIDATIERWNENRVRERSTQEIVFDPKEYGLPTKE